MRVLVVGASKGTGALVVKTAIEKGHDVSAFARNPDRLTLDSPRLKRIKGDFHDAASVNDAVPGHDAVVITASVASLSQFKENPKYISQGTELLIAAMKANGVRRLVVLSAMGAGESLQASNFIVRHLLVGWILKLAYQDHDRQEAMTRASGLEWVIARPTRLTDGPARGKYVKQPEVKPVPSSISRADTAGFLVEACETPQWVGKAVQLGG